MHYVYLLYSASKKQFYVGCSADLKLRFSVHNASLSKSTQSGVPWKLIYYEAYPTKADALRRERNLKHYGQGLRRLKERLSLVD